VHAVVGPVPDGASFGKSLKCRSSLYSRPSYLCLELQLACSVVDASGNQATCAYTIVVQDNQKPSVMCPSRITEATEAGKPYATITYESSAADNSGHDLSSTCSLASGSQVTIGLTAVTCNATDSSGNTGVCGFDITVLDEEAPILFCPSTVGPFNTSINQATGLLGFPLPRAGDNSGQAVTVTCNPSVGARVPIGSHNITCTATDTSGQMSQCSFAGTLVDRQAPDFSNCPPSRLGKSSTSKLTDTFVLATDNDGSAPGVVCQPPANSSFEVGTTAVMCAAVDAAGNAAACNFDAVIVDDEAPVLQCPDAISVPTASRAVSAIVTWSAATATDNVGVAGSVTCLPASGALFDFGINQVFFAFVALLCGCSPFTYTGELRGTRCGWQQGHLLVCSFRH